MKSFFDYLKHLFRFKKRVRYHCDFCFEEMNEDTMVIEVRGDILHATKKCVNGHWKNLRYSSNGTIPLPLSVVLKRRKMDQKNSIK